MSQPQPTQTPTADDLRALFAAVADAAAAETSPPDANTAARVRAGVEANFRLAALANPGVPYSAHEDPPTFWMLGENGQLVEVQPLSPSAFAAEIASRKRRA